MVISRCCLTRVRFFFQSWTFVSMAFFYSYWMSCSSPTMGYKIHQCHFSIA
ncbi:hypothetical protein K450DRAFT_240773 [Umbelopsis ramanniana AG]|uniref:Uncharacterized protein n=1 Tax=Umbelopsis ramanniana AG TaxID=1314678 RepID=A0AAD5E9J0_UMBRA|nr:uncharacterized protein K450DRAFT_240773 [Umbelopsis ramanniana AG]KAI8579638.1 hypothetical protein K450DRAFT_240773 [Umbelopsis ramanniana AG]